MGFGLAASRTSLLADVDWGVVDYPRPPPAKLLAYSARALSALLREPTPQTRRPRRWAEVAIDDPPASHVIDIASMYSGGDDFYEPQNGARGSARRPGMRSLQ